MLHTLDVLLQAWNYLGTASELAGRGTSAVTAYRRALGLLEEQGSRFGTGDAWVEAVRVARVNLGRALVLSGEAGEAVCCLEAGDSTEVLLFQPTSAKEPTHFQPAAWRCVVSLSWLFPAQTRSRPFADTTRFIFWLCLFSFHRVSSSCLRAWCASLPALGAPQWI